MLNIDATKRKKICVGGNLSEKKNRKERATERVSTMFYDTRQGG